MQVAGYELLERIGSGGMGEVYKAFHPGLGRAAAVKMLYRKEMTARFENEALIQASIQHPNIARVYAYSAAGDRPCIVMEYVEGIALDQHLRSKGKLDNIELSQLLLQVVNALQHLHHLGIAHRDIKPQNFKLEPNGTLKMLDFGIAKTKDTPRLTQLGFMVGTTEYMAPEQFRQVHDLRADVWSLGVMAYELATGYLPFESTDAAALRGRIQRGQFTPPRVLAPQLSLHLEALIEGSLRVAPAARLRLHEIQQLLGEKAPGKPVFRISISTAHKRLLAYGAAAVLVIVLATVLLAGNGSSTVQAPPQSDTALQGTTIQVRVNVPSVPGATLILPDGTKREAPFDFEGKEGETAAFTIRAEGYADKNVQLTITPRRKTYEYTLEAINQ